MGAAATAGLPEDDAADQLRDDGLVAEQIETLRCRVPDGEAPVICEPWEGKQASRSDHHARWSMPVCLPQVLIRGSLSPADVTGIATDPDVLGLAARTSWNRWSDSGFPVRFPARLTVTTTSGSEVAVEVDDVRGSAARPIAPEEIHDKFLANARPVLGEAAGATALATVDKLPALDDVRELTALLRAERASARSRAGRSDRLPARTAPDSEAWLQSPDHDQRLSHRRRLYTTGMPLVGVV